MPTAKGLFHKAVALSGSSLGGVNKEYAEKLGVKILEEAGLKIGEFEKLQRIPWREYIDIANRAVDKMAEEAKRMKIARGGFGPVADGLSMSDQPFFSDPSHFSANIPLMINTNFHEQSPSRTDASLELITFEGVVDKIKGRFGDDSAKIVAAFQKNFPKAKPIEVWALILSNRKGAVATADAKFSQGKAPVFLSWFGWQPHYLMAGCGLFIVMIFVFGFIIRI